MHRILVPVLPRDKKPGWAGKPQAGWEKLRLNPERLGDYFTADSNIGVVLGSASGGLVDVDLDCPEANALADQYLPPTHSFGRAGTPRAHRLFLAPGVVTTQFRDLPARGSKNHGAMLIELRGDAHLGPGSQTVFPPSVHPSGEQILWSGDADGMERPLRVDGGQLRHRIIRLAQAVLLARHGAPGAVDRWRSGGPYDAPREVVDHARSWEGIRPTPVCARPRARAKVGSGLAELNELGPALVASKLGLEVVARRGEKQPRIAPCPGCGDLQRGYSNPDHRPPIDITTNGKGWLCFRCDSRGDAVALAAAVVVGRAKGLSRSEWQQVHERCRAVGLLGRRQ